MGTSVRPCLPAHLRLLRLGVPSCSAVKGKFETGASQFGFKRSFSSSFRRGLIGSTCTTLPSEVGDVQRQCGPETHHGSEPQYEIESKV